MVEREPVVCDGSSLRPEDVVAVARDDAPVTVPEETRADIRDARERVEEIVDSGATAYGLNTGFGELVDERISPDKIDQLQTNLLRSHASGAGRVLTRPEVRALLVTRINALAVGYSGIRELVVDRLVEMLNRGVHPVVRSRGSLGASGDLAPLAHASLVLIGEGEAVVDTDDRRPQPSEADARMSGQEALESVDLEAVTLTAKEGLALINGTQLTVGLASLFLIDAERALSAADAAGSLSIEVSMGTDAITEPAIHEARPHAGQLETARDVALLLEDSEIILSHRDCDRIQDAYSMRCIPQVHGAVRDALVHLREAVETELNSATDNPLLFSGDRIGDRATGTPNARVISGGNFHGEPLALRLDYALSALTELAAISERRVDRLINPNVQESHLPPFLTPDSGLNSGYMIAQYTATAMLNELRSIGRASIDSTPVSGNQEDHVSMSAQSALNARRGVSNLITVVAIELLCACQAAEFVDDDLGHGRGTDLVYDAVRELVPPLEDDRPLHDEIDAVGTLVRSGLLDERIRSVLPDSAA
ncbi:histidine ammonia-lyase [Natrarchaeobius halalkaliphilus]|uniref:Histidine ammonia-lyase n=1 Tax=Natrarchaeobius halalkaliphilus TaxID=1679091 RepID=A0A3N6M5N1_9EURY|nr:histidine ammonia-lyase [Natrarchaeobius halalkaliphilus]RQG88059.1 histidine ammonia-lyase [Natrarchaeobius halalkaliphilus]